MTHERSARFAIPAIARIAGGLALVGCLAVGCVRSAVPSASVASADRAASLRRQLSGHLERARGCLSEARLRDPDASGLVRFGFTIGTDGRVGDVSVEAWSEDERMLGACVRSRLTSLFFDPAPPSRPIRIERTFYRCPDERDGMCRLGAARALEAELDPELLGRVSAGLAARDDALEACANQTGGAPTVLDVRLELGEDGRIMAGQLNGAFPAGSPLSRCAVGPLLGAQIDGETPSGRTQLRYVYRLGATSTAPRTAQLSR